MCYLQDMIQRSLLSDRTTEQFGKVKYVLQYLLVEDIHAEHMMSDQTRVDGGSRCDDSRKQIRVTVALIFGGVANW